MVLNSARFKRGLKRIKAAPGEKVERWIQERAEKKRLYKEAYTAAEIKAIQEKARREAREKHLGVYVRHVVRRKGKGRRKARKIYYKRDKAAPSRARGPGLFDLPSGFGGATVFGPAPRKRKSKPRKKKTTGRRRRPRKVVFY